MNATQTRHASPLPFEAAGGSVVGRAHVAAGRNNQDAIASISWPGIWVGVVCDGCSSGRHSEVGAQLGARWFARALAATTAVSGRFERPHLDPALERAAEAIRRAAGSLGDDLATVVLDYFLFTVVAAVVTPDSAFAFAIGDGVVAINGETARLGPYPGNAPPYLGYWVTGDVSQTPPVVTCHDGPAESLESLLIGSDGVSDFVKAATRCLPGRQEAVGALSQFWEEDRFFDNPDNVRRRLSLVSRDRVRRNDSTSAVKLEAGLLPDDTSLLVLRRRKS